MRVRPIHNLASIGQAALTIGLLSALFAAPARAQRRPEKSTGQPAAERSEHPRALSPSHPPAIRTIQPPAQPQPPLSPFVPPRPAIPPAIRPAGGAPLESGQDSRAPVRTTSSFLQRPPLRPAGPPKPLPSGKPYCSPLSVQYNTGSICFNPDLFTINPAFLPIEPYVPPPVAGAADESHSSLIPPALLLQYCASCATQNAGFTPEDAIRRAKEPSLSLPRATPMTPPGPPMILVLKNGAMPLVGRYWLGNDWLIHFVTVGGQTGAIPTDMLNLNATGEMNFHRGVVFSLPGWPDHK